MIGGQLSKQDEYFQEYQAIERECSTNYKELYDRKKKFIKEEIQRCEDYANYESEMIN